MADLRSGGRARCARAQLDGVDATSPEYFRDSPAYSEYDATSSCQKTKIGDLVDPKYLEELLAASFIAQAIEAYDDGPPCSVLRSAAVDRAAAGDDADPGAARLPRHGGHRREHHRMRYPDVIDEIIDPPTAAAVR
jgi:hypothetical protein